MYAVVLETFYLHIDTLYVYAQLSDFMLHCNIPKTAIIIIMFTTFASLSLE